MKGGRRGDLQMGGDGAPTTGHWKAPGRRVSYRNSWVFLGIMVLYGLLQGFLTGFYRFITLYSL